MKYVFDILNNYSLNISQNGEFGLRLGNLGQWFKMLL